MSTRRFDAKALALSFALLWSVGLFLITWWVILIHGRSEEINLIGKVYIGYTFTPKGSLIGFAWAFFDGLIGGAIFAWLYNLLAGRERPAAQGA